jgi:hypothetical protein
VLYSPRLYLYLTLHVTVLSVVIKRKLQPLWQPSPHSWLAIYIQKISEATTIWDKVFCLLGERYSLWTSVVLSVSLATLKAPAFSVCSTASRLAKRLRLLILFARFLDLISRTLFWSSVLPRFNRVDWCRGKVAHDCETWRRVRESRNIVRLILNLGAEWSERSGLRPGSFVGKDAGAHWIEDVVGGQASNHDFSDTRLVAWSVYIVSLLASQDNKFRRTSSVFYCNLNTLDLPLVSIWIHKTQSTLTHLYTNLC